MTLHITPVVTQVADTAHPVGTVVLFGVTCIKPQLAINAKAREAYKFGWVGSRLYPSHYHPRCASQWHARITQLIRVNVKPNIEIDAMFREIPSTPIGTFFKSTARQSVPNSICIRVMVSRRDTSKAALYRTPRHRHTDTDTHMIYIFIYIYINDYSSFRYSKKRNITYIGIVLSLSNINSQNYGTYFAMIDLIWS